jgi:hypothetical protein
MYFASYPVQRGEQVTIQFGSTHQHRTVFGSLFLLILLSIIIKMSKKYNMQEGISLKGDMK